MLSDEQSESQEECDIDQSGSNMDKISDVEQSDFSNSSGSSRSP